MMCLSGCGNMNTASSFEDDRGRNRNRDDNDGENSRDNSRIWNEQKIFSPEECARQNNLETRRPISSELQEGENPNSSFRPAVDVLFVLNTKKSMKFYLEEAFSIRFSNFISKMDNSTNWRFLFTTTDFKNKMMEGVGFPYLHGTVRIWTERNALGGQAMKIESAQEGILLERYYLDNSVPDYEQAFINTITRKKEKSCRFPPHCHGSLVQPLKSLRTAFSINRSLIREEADLAVVIISNADEEPINSPYRVQPGQVISEFNNIYSSRKRLFVFSLIIPPDDQICLKANRDRQGIFSKKSVHYGLSLDNLVEQTNRGGVFSICKADYSGIAEQISCQVNSNE